MSLDQLPPRMREFANYLDGLLARLDPRGGGWCAVFWQRDPDGMQACLDGREVPPWDVMDALLQDLAALYGPDTAGAERERARLLHAAALAAYDAQPGARAALGEHLDAMLREQRYAAERQSELGRALTSAATSEQARTLHLDLSWARDDHQRATARCLELRERIADLERRAAGSSGGDARASVPPASEATSPAKQRKRRRGSARFGGLAEDDTAAGSGDVPLKSAPQGPADGSASRGVRYAGAGDGGEPAPASRPDAEAQLVVAGAVATLLRLRGEGRSGEAHALLAEAAHWPAGRLPLLAAELERAALGADWSTLLWETASLPVDGLVAAADALVEAGRTDDGQQILRHGVARPAAEIGEAVLGLEAEGRRREVRVLLDAYVRVRTPEDAASSAAPDPACLVPLLLEAAQGVSDERRWDLVHALRVAGFAV